MYNEEIINLFEEVNKTIEKILKRTSMVLTVNDFLLSDADMGKLDAACMLLQTIGENIKTIDNKNQSRITIPI